MLKKRVSLPFGSDSIDYIAIALTALIIIWLLLWASLGDGVSYLGYINAGGFVFGFIAAICGIFLLIRKRWFVAIPSFLLAGFLIAYPSGGNFAAGEDRLNPSDIRIMSASLRGLNRDMAGTAKKLAQYDADIIGLQEVYDPAAFQSALQKASGRKYNITVKGKLVLLSAYQLEQIDNGADKVLAANIMTPGRALAVWTLRAPKAYDKPLTNRQFFSDLKKNIAKSSPDAVIGDFNATPWNDGYVAMAKNMVNAQQSAGFGPGSSFPGPARMSGAAGALARIDHIFVKTGITIANAFTGTAYHKSDHHPVIADLRIGRQNVTP